eukprot:TRINITY_DN3955_c0_g2_i1.p5 TRINITY_DN3955_c0_g2~~TRINITY_DN3955_c0_g2_i1.p5  ORF type:complete len:117 (+),score=18.63 TRINITY_DN3955_c0_g2_i1:3-353(+)
MPSAVITDSVRAGASMQLCRLTDHTTNFCLQFFFFFNDTATTEIYTRSIVGSVRCVQETGINAEYMGMEDEKSPKKRHISRSVRDIYVDLQRDWNRLEQGDLLFTLPRSIRNFLTL